MSVFLAAWVVATIGTFMSFGWRTYRKFGADRRGQPMKQMYARRKILLSLVKLDMLITFSVFVVLWNYADSEYIWPSKLYDQQHWVLVASVVSALWLPLIQFSVVRERGDVVKLSLPVAFVEPAVVVEEVERWKEAARAALAAPRRLCLARLEDLAMTKIE